MTAEQLPAQRTEAEIRDVWTLIYRNALPETMGPVRSWDREGKEHARLRAIIAVLAWAVGDGAAPGDSQVARDTFLWLTGDGPCPVDERGHTPGFRVRSRRTA